MSARVDHGVVSGTFSLDGETFDVEPAELALIRAGEHEQVALNADGSATVTLLEPLTLGKDQITELTMRRPKLKDLRRAEEMAKGSPLARMSTMIQLLSGQAQKLIDELSSHDANVAGLVAAFLGERRPRTGATS